MIVGLSPFFEEQWANGGFYQDGYWTPELVRSAAALCIDQAIPGYRTGVILVPINTMSWRTRILTMVPNQEATVKFKARVEGEAPRKTLPLVEVPSITDLPLAKSVFVVLYRNDVLAERDEPRSGSFWDVVTVLANPSPEQVPMNPETLIANHFGLDGGTTTNMTPEQFTRALHNSVLYWRDKAMAYVKEAVKDSSCDCLYETCTCAVKV
jgi:hypothetical protein